MAERRMFAKTIIDSDAFIDMPVTARLLYYDLAMRADDDGFVNSPKKIMRMIGASQDDLSILIMRKFIIPFESGIVVIKHWRIHNYIRTDRYSETTYKAEKEALTLDENKAYTVRYTNGRPMVDQMDTNGIPTVDPGKDRLGKDRLGKDRLTDAHNYSKVVLTDDERAELVRLSDSLSVEAYIRKIIDWQVKAKKMCSKPFIIIKEWIDKDESKRKIKGKNQNKDTSYDLNEWEQFAMNFDPT